MATITVGTTSSTALTGLVFQPNCNVADLATINADIFPDNNPAYDTIPANVPTALSTSGILKLPGGRGEITLLPGDVIAVDPVTGWPIVLSKNCAANGAFDVS